MLKKYFPYEYCKSVYDIDYEKLYQSGFRALIFDVDNTLVHHGDDADEQIEEFFISLHKMGFKTLLLTDNDEERVQRFNKNINTLYICDANKPEPEQYINALKMLNAEKKQAVVIGDRMFRDILGANNAQLASVMVKYITTGEEKWLGWNRYLEFVMLFLWRHGRYHKRLGGISRSEEPSLTENIRLFFRHELLFCDISPLCYKISESKETIKRHIYNITHRENYLKEKSCEPLKNVMYRYESGLIKRGKGIDPETQYNKAENIKIAGEHINGALIRPGEVFSFWKLVGPTTENRGYKKGRVLERGNLITGVGGGLCNLGNTMHLLALHSPLDVTEVHYHSDALAADHGERVPLSSGTAVNYNSIDLRFKNNTDQTFQILVNVKDEKLYAELRSDGEVSFDYEITEENHHFTKENNKYFRVSKIYRDTIDKQTNEVIDHRLIRDNHSEVMFDYSLIPQELIRND